MSDETNRAPDETLRAAAGRLRLVAGAATPGPWRLVIESPCGSTIDYAQVKAGDSLIADCGATDLGDVAEVNAALIAAMHPGAAVALAAWLDKEADGWDLMPAAERAAIARGEEMHMQHSAWDEALTVARVVLGET